MDTAATGAFAFGSGGAGVAFSKQRAACVVHIVHFAVTVVVFAITGFESRLYFSLTGAGPFALYAGFGTFLTVSFSTDAGGAGVTTACVAIFAGTTSIGFIGFAVAIVVFFVATELKAGSALVFATGIPDALLTALDPASTKTFAKRTGGASVAVTSQRISGALFVVDNPVTIVIFTVAGFCRGGGGGWDLPGTGVECAKTLSHAASTTAFA